LLTFFNFNREKEGGNQKTTFFERKPIFIVNLLGDKDLSRNSYGKGAVRQVLACRTEFGIPDYQMESLDFRFSEPLYSEL